MSRIDLFDQLRRGDQEAFEGLKAVEQEPLYDYLYRMTGDMNLSYRGVDEVTEAVLSEAQNYQDYRDFRLSLYSTGRRFNADHWNAPTEHLMTQKPTPIADIEDELDEDEFFDPYKEVERVFCALPGPEREALLLHYKAGFTVAETAQIMGVAEDRVHSALKAASQELEALVPDEGRLKEALAGLPHHRIPEEMTTSTMALSQVIENVKKSQSFMVPPWLILLGILFVTAWLAYNFKDLLP